MSYPKRVTIDAARTLAFGGVGVAYAAVGTPLEAFARIIAFKNLLGVTIWISFDGVNDHLILPSSNSQIIDFSTNQSTIENYFVAQGTQFYVRHIAGGAPQDGLISIEVMR